MIFAELQFCFMTLAYKQENPKPPPTGDTYTEQVIRHSLIKIKTLTKITSILISNFVSIGKDVPEPV